MKDDMGMTDVSTRVFPSGFAIYDDSVRALKEVLGMNDREATASALSVRTFPKRDKKSVKEAHVSALIVTSKSHFIQELKSKILAAWCPVTGFKLPTKRTRNFKGTMPGANASGSGKNAVKPCGKTRNAFKNSNKTTEAAKQHALAIVADKLGRA